MGVDVNLYGIGVVTDDEMAAAEAYLQERVPGDKYTTPRLTRSEYDDDGRIEFGTWYRYYGPGYERGPWPGIYGDIIAFAASLPQCKIYYGSDSSDDGELVTNESMDEMWMHWLGPHGNDYRRSWQRELPS